MKQKALFTPALTASSFKKTCKFSNAPRFNLKIDNPTDFKYDVSSKRVSRSTSFGVGPRPVMVNSLAAPNPDRYHLSGFTKGRHGKSIGEGRYKLHFRSLTYEVEKKTELPSPDAYNTPEEQGLSFTLRVKLPDEADREIKKRVPGPGQYAQIQMNREGKYFTSKIKNTRSITFAGPKREGLSRTDTQVGPASYDVYNVDSSFSDQRVKVMRRNTAKHFGTGSRSGVEDSTKSSVPGPGQYESFSSFGGRFVPGIS